MTNGELPPFTEPEEKTFLDYSQEMYEARHGFFGQARQYAQSPTTGSRQLFQEKAKELAIAFYGCAGHVLLNVEGGTDFTKAQVVFEMQQKEDLHRVSALNSIICKEVLRPSTSTAEEYTDVRLGDGLSEIDYDEWVFEEIKDFTQALAVDMTSFVSHVETTKTAKRERFKESVTSKATGIATVAGGVALGILIAREVDKRI